MHVVSEITIFQIRSGGKSVLVGDGKRIDRHQLPSSVVGYISTEHRAASRFSREELVQYFAVHQSDARGGRSSATILCRQR